MRKILIFLILICLLPTHAFASLEFFALLPNPAGDDTLGEYIEIRNTGCQAVDIGGYRLYDAANNTYTIPSGTTIGVHENISFPYRDTKISLNNSGIETITLATSTGEIINTEGYSGTQRDNIVISLNPVDEDCSVIPPIESNTGTTSTGTTSTGTTDSGDINSGSTDSGTTSTGTIDTGSGASETSGGQATGTTSTGSFVPQDDGSTSTGTTNTGSTDSGTTDSVSTNTGVINEIILPEIVPTRQEPTNATLSGNVWDCGLNQPCRVNVTFDPIFTGSFLSKNYICEVITATGTITTCNPNTLYFSTDSSFSFRLTSKLDPSQSMTMTWGVRFTVTQDESAIEDASMGATNTGSFVPQDDVNASTGTIEDSHTGVIFPQIIPTFQNYTNTTNSGDTLTCVTSPCRVNFTLDPIFTGSFLAKNYTCEIHYGTGVYDSCNPPQLYPIGTGSIEIILTHKASGQKEIKTIEVLQNITIASVSPKTPTNIAPADIAKDTTKPVAIIDFDGTLKSYYEQVNDYEFNCYTMTCSVNLTAERSYDPDGSDIRYLWIYGQNEIKTTRDPGTRKYTIGDHTIVFRVIDTAGNYDEIRYIIHVLGPKSEEEKKTKIKKERSGDQKTSGGQKKKKKKN